jgi:hypothetical protein
MAINFPDSPSVNDEFTAADRTWIWDGTTWLGAPVDIPPGTQVSDTAPSSPEVGQMWWESDSGILYVYYDNFWIEAPIAAPGVNGADGGFDSSQVVENKSSDYTLQSTDKGKLITSSAAITITVQGLSIGQQVDFLQTTSDKITFTAGSGATLNSKLNKLKTAAAYSPASIKCIGLNSYVLIGDLGD